MMNVRGVHTIVKWKTRHHLKPGDIGYLTYLHGTLYATEQGYDHTFEAYVAAGFAEFVQSFNPDRDRIWVAETNHRIIGSIAIVGHSKTDAQLRWFLVHPDFRRLGIGKALLKKALRFSKKCRYDTVFLWTVDELEEAGRLYSRFGFRKTDEKTHQIWGKNLTEERYDLHV